MLVRAGPPAPATYPLSPRPGWVFVNPVASQITISLPDDVAFAARAEGLLQSPRIEQLLQRELSRVAMEKFSGLRNLPGSVPTEEEIQREVEAVRARPADR